MENEDKKYKRLRYDEETMQLIVVDCSSPNQTDEEYCEESKKHRESVLKNDSHRMESITKECDLVLVGVGSSKADKIKSIVSYLVSRVKSSMLLNCEIQEQLEKERLSNYEALDEFRSAIERNMKLSEENERLLQENSRLGAENIKFVVQLDEWKKIDKEPENKKSKKNKEH